MNQVFFLTAIEVEPSVPKHSLLDFSSPEGLFVFGAVGLVVIALVIGTYFYVSRRNERKHHRRHRHRHTHDEGQTRRERSRPADADDEPPEVDARSGAEDGDEEVETSEPGESSSRRRKRRRRRREHRPRNPTLAETGGLPPIRTEAPPGP